MTQPDASAQIDITAPAARVYALVSDPGALAELAPEYRGHRWLGGATRAAVGAKFVGTNKNGFRPWFTVCTVTDATEGERYGFDVAFGPVPIAHWRYEISPAGDGVRVVESMWDRRPGWMAKLGGVLTGVKERVPHNERNMAATLRAVKERAERG